MTNTITPLTEVASSQSSPTDLWASTLFFTALTVGYGLYYLKGKLEELQTSKKDNDTGDLVDENVYQCWSGTYANGDDSLVVTIVRQKHCTVGANDAWIEWDGSADASTVTRDFYLGNKSPSFDWQIEKRDYDTKSIVKDTMVDGWTSLVHLKLTAFVKEDATSEYMNRFLKQLVDNGRIEWHKQLLPKEEFTAIFQ